MMLPTPILLPHMHFFGVFGGYTARRHAEPVHTWSRVMANNAALDNALDEMALNTAKQEHSVFFAGQRARQYMAALNGKGVFLGSTGPVPRYLGPHLDIMGSIRPELERRRAAAFRTWTRFRPVWFRAGIPLRVRRLFFPGAGGFNSVYGSGIPSPAIPGLRIFGPFHLVSWAQDDERKSDNNYETGRWHRKKAHSRQKEGVGFPGPGIFCHGTARSSPSMVPESHEGSDGPLERLVFLLWRSFF